MKKQTFVLSAIILALGGFFAKAIGALYKIPLTNILGSSGIGLYYLIFPIYSLIISFCSSGISVALTTEVAKCRKIRHRYNEQKLLRVALILSFLLSFIFSLMIVFLSHYLAELQGNVNATFGYVTISPAIIISTLIATLRGYFQGIENMIPTTVSMIIEQIIKLSVGLILAHKLCVFGIEYAVIGAVLGVTISEVVAFIIIVINFITYKGQLYYNYRNLNYKSKRKIYVKSQLKKQYLYNICSNKNFVHNTFICNSKKIRYSNKVALIKLLKVAIPSTFASILIPISTMLDSFMIINLLNASGYSSLVSTSLYGLWGGVVQSLISLPTIIISAISTSLVPSLSGLIVYNDTNEIRQRVAFFIKITWILSILMFVIIYVFAEDILIFLYGNGLSSDVINELFYATKMLKISSLSIIYYAFLQTFISILQALGKSYIPFVAIFISLIIRTFLVFILVSVININIFGAIIANIVFLSLSTIILAYSITQSIEFNYTLKSLIKPLIIGIIVMCFCLIAHWGLKSVLNYFISTLIVGFVGIIIYLSWIYFGNIFNEKELKYFKIGKKSISKRKDKV